MPTATIHDVARLAGVSISVVSRALNGRAGVNAATRQRVQAAATALGYEPPQRARETRSWDIAVITSRPLDELERSPIYYRGIAALQAGAEELGCRLIMLSASALLASAGSPHFDAAVLYHLENNEVLARLRHDKPFVLVGRRSLDPTVAFAATDDTYGAYDATIRLLAAGRRRIAYIGDTSQPELNPNSLRFNAYRKALAEANITAEPELWSDETGQPLQQMDAEQIANFWQRVRPDAFFAFNDSIAARILQALQRLRVEVPAECAVVGFDNTYLAELCYPTLSTVHNPIDHVCYLALHHLYRTLRLGCPLVSRTLVNPWYVRRQWHDTRPGRGDARPRSCCRKHLSDLRQQIRSGHCRPERRSRPGDKA